MRLATHDNGHNGHHGYQQLNHQPKNRIRSGNERSKLVIEPSGQMLEPTPLSPPTLPKTFIFSPVLNKIILLIALFVFSMVGSGCNTTQAVDQTHPQLVFVTFTPAPQSNITFGNPASGATVVAVHLKPNTPTVTPQGGTPAQGTATPVTSSTPLATETITPTPSPTSVETLPTATPSPTASATPTTSTSGTTVQVDSVTMEAPGCTEPVQTMVRVRDVANLQGVDFRLHFNPAQVQVVDANPNEAGIQIMPGQIFRSQNSFVAVNQVDTTNGTIDLAVVLVGQTTINGDEVLAEINWDVQETGTINLTLEKVDLASSEGNRIEAGLTAGVLVIPTECSGNLN